MSAAVNAGKNAPVNAAMTAETRFSVRIKAFCTEKRYHFLRYVHICKVPQSALADVKQYHTANLRRVTHMSLPSLLLRLVSHTAARGSVP